MKKNLIQKYNVPGPRYTSYPTVPYWNELLFSKDLWVETLKRSFKESNTTEGISLYIHLPFCESLCTFCGCNKRITKNHNVEHSYIEALLKEWDIYCELLEKKPVIKEIHLGGGTPTFFSSEHLEKLIHGILSTGRLQNCILYKVWLNLTRNRVQGKAWREPYAVHRPKKYRPAGLTGMGLSP